MDINFLIRGLVIGFSIAAPVGPIGILCIQRTLAEGRASGLISGLGAATADAIYGCIAGFGLTIISSTLIAQQVWLRLVGGGFLCFLGLKTSVAKPTEQTTLIERKGLVSSYVSTFFLTATNPMTLLSFAAVFAGLGVGDASGSYYSAPLLILGVFIGSALWWFVLSGITNTFRTKFIRDRLKLINRVSGIIIMTLGVAALLGLAY